MWNTIIYFNQLQDDNIFREGNINLGYRKSLIFSALLSWKSRNEKWPYIAPSLSNIITDRFYLSRSNDFFSSSNFIKEKSLRIKNYYISTFRIMKTKALFLFFFLEKNDWIGKLWWETVYYIEYKILITFGYLFYVILSESNVKKNRHIDICYIYCS